MTNTPLILNHAAMCGSLDNTFKAANKATLTDRDRQKSRELKGGILSVLNEDNQIISWVSFDNDSPKVSLDTFSSVPSVALLPDTHECGDH
jgi:hypothetical protein